MMRMEIKDFGQDEWNDSVSKFYHISLMQTWEFGEVKAETGLWEVWRALFHHNNEIVGATQAMVRKIPFLKRGLVWINRAPIVNKKYVDQSDVYIDMLRELKEYWVEKRGMYLRIAPALSAQNENYKIFQEADYLQATETDGWASDIVDLSFPIEELRKGLHQKWRNCLNKSERLNVTCEAGDSDSLFEEMLDNYRELLDNRGFGTNLAPDFLKSMQGLLPSSRKMVALAARQDGNKLGSILVVTYGDSCMYLLGATSSTGRKVNANHYLIWSALCEMKKRGYRWFDVGGAHPDNTPPGILHFKRGLKGKPYQLMGDVEAYKEYFINAIIRKRILSIR